MSSSASILWVQAGEAIGLASLPVLLYWLLRRKK
jgi:hypothetical protein